MHIVLDTCALQNMLKKVSETSKLEITVALKSGDLVLYFDPDTNLVSEWGQTCGREIIARLIEVWTDWGCINILSSTTKLSNVQKKKLRLMGFQKPIDKVVLEIAQSTPDKIAATDDCEFWDPKNTRSIGDINSPVYKYCHDELGVEVISGPELVSRCTP